MIQVENVVKSFGSRLVVDHISFHVREGETAVLLGPSGSGKSTTLRMINRLVPMDAGRISVEGNDVTRVPGKDLRRRMGYVLQHYGLFPHFTVAENIAVVPGLLNWPKDRIAARTRELLQQLHLDEEYLPRYPHELSGGQQQRVGLARAMAADPPVLLMDEPFGALDTVTRSHIVREFSQMEIRKKKTIVLVTHDIAEAFQLGDVILLMNQGKIVQAGRPAELLFRPADDFVTSFFAEKRLELEMGTVRIADIRPYLPPQADGQPPGRWDESRSVWQALQFLSDRRPEDASEGAPAPISYHALLNAFDAYKRDYHA